MKIWNPLQVSARECESWFLGWNTLSRLLVACRLKIIFFFFSSLYFINFSPYCLKLTFFLFSKSVHGHPTKTTLFSLFYQATMKKSPPSPSQSMPSPSNPPTTESLETPVQMETVMPPVQTRPASAPPPAQDARQQASQGEHRGTRCCCYLGVRFSWWQRTRKYHRFFHFSLFPFLVKLCF